MEWLETFEREHKVVKLLEKLAKSLMEFDQQAALLAYELAVAADLKFSRAIALVKSDYSEEDVKEALVVRQAGRFFAEHALTKCVEVLNSLL